MDEKTLRRDEMKKNKKRQMTVKERLSIENNRKRKKATNDEQRNVKDGEEIEVVEEGEKDRDIEEQYFFKKRPSIKDKLNASQKSEPNQTTVWNMNMKTSMLMLWKLIEIGT